MKMTESLTLSAPVAPPREPSVKVDIPPNSGVSITLPGAADEAEIIERSKAGDRVAFNELVRRHQKKVFNLCYRIMGNREEAEDVTQEVFITVYKALRGFRGDSAFSTWIHRVAANHCKNRLKHLKRRRYFQTSSIDETYETGEGEQKKEYASDEFDSPEEEMERTQTYAEINKAIAELEDEYKIVIVMRDVRGLSYQEIADALELKEGTVKSRIHRARLELQAKLRHLMDTE